MKQPQLILFDIGGVLIDCNDSFKTAAKDLKIPIRLIDEVFDKYEAEITLGEISTQQLYEYLLKENKISLNANYDFVKSWVNDYRQISTSSNLLLALSEKYEIGLLSNTYSGIVDEAIKTKKLPDINYAYQFLSCELGLQKPDLEIYKYVEKQTGYSADEILFIDDRLDFLKVPSKRGWRVELFCPANVSALTKRLLG